MRLLALDIENSFIQAAVWSLWDNMVPIDRIFDSGKILCYAAQWVGDKKSKMVFKKHNDDDFLLTIHEMLDQADAVLTYNGRKHDIPWINKEFVKAGLLPPSPYKHIDLLETMKKQFKFASNKLDWVLRELKLGKKVEHEGFPLWVKCVEGDAQAWKDMERYNRNDVTQLIKVYKKIMPWIASHPNHNMYSTHGESVCSTCGSKHVHQRGWYRTGTGLYKRFQCQSCGHWNRTRYTELEKDQRKKVLVSAV